MARLWAKRDEQIHRVVESTGDLYGDLQAIAGRALHEIEGLELAMLPAGESSSSGCHHSSRLQGTDPRLMSSIAIHARERVSASIGKDHLSAMPVVRPLGFPSTPLPCHGILGNFRELMGTERNAR